MPWEGSKPWSRLRPIWPCWPSRYRTGLPWERSSASGPSCSRPSVCLSAARTGPSCWAFGRPRSRCKRSADEACRHACVLALSSEGWNDAVTEAGLAARMHGLPVCPRIEFAEQAGAEPRLLAALYAQEMAKRGVLMNSHPMPSAAHDEEDLAWTLHATCEALSVVAEACRLGRVEETLEVSLVPPSFRRLVN